MSKLYCIERDHQGVRKFVQAGAGRYSWTHYISERTGFRSEAEAKEYARTRSIQGASVTPVLSHGCRPATDWQIAI